MIKRDEIRDPNSCFNKAGEFELIFVLLGRDIAAASTIRTWAQERIRLGKNKPNDPQILEALHCAERMAQPPRPPYAR